MPNAPAPGQVSRPIRMPAYLWQLAGEVTTANGTDRGTVIREFLRWYVGEEGAELPTPGASR